MDLVAAHACVDRIENAVRTLKTWAVNTELAGLDVPVRELRAHLDGGLANLDLPPVTPDAPAPGTTHDPATFPDGSSMAVTSNAPSQPVALAQPDGVAVVEPVAHQGILGPEPQRAAFDLEDEFQTAHAAWEAAREAAAAQPQPAPVAPLGVSTEAGTIAAADNHVDGAATDEEEAAVDSASA